MYLVYSYDIVAGGMENFIIHGVYFSEAFADARVNYLIDQEDSRFTYSLYDWIELEHGDQKTYVE